MVDIELVKKCQAAAKQIRRDIIDMAYATGNTGAHLGGSLSVVEILAVLYAGVLQYTLSNPEWQERDRVILSKGHAALALYPSLVQAGILHKEELSTFKQDGSRLTGHPSLHGIPGIEFASGSLGQGLSLGVGVGLALQRNNNLKPRIFVILGDGECDEGSVWEAAAAASHFGIKQLVAIVDENQIQYDGYTTDIMNMRPSENKWKDFGWSSIVVDGHNIEALLCALSTKDGGKPLAIIAKTIKGKGVSYMENNWRFHNSRLTKEQYEQALIELEKEI